MATVQTLTLYPSGYVSDDYSYASISNVGNGYTASSSTTYAQINLKTGSSAETYLYYTFDTPNIPDDAVICEVVCTAKAMISNQTTSRISSRTIQLYSNTTAKGSSTNLTTTKSELSLTTSDWTIDELRNIRLKLYAKRGTSGTSSSYYIRFYGATLTIKYVVPETIPIVGNNTIGGVSKTIAGGYCNIGGTWKDIVKSYANVNGIWVPTWKVSEISFTWKKYTAVVPNRTYRQTTSGNVVLSVTHGVNYYIGTGYSFDTNTGEYSLKNKIEIDGSEYQNYYTTYKYIQSIGSPQECFYVATMSGTGESNSYFTVTKYKAEMNPYYAVAWVQEDPSYHSDSEWRNGSHYEELNRKKLYSSYTVDNSTGKITLSNYVGIANDFDTIMSYIPNYNNKVYFNKYDENNTQYSMYGFNNTSSVSSDGFNVIYSSIYEETDVTEVQGTYIEDVTSSSYTAYPENGKHTDGYWYILQ